MLHESTYVTLRDGTRLAVSTWVRAENIPSLTPRPVILQTTRYWRALELHIDKVEYQPIYPLANELLSNGFNLVIADARGSGASFGTRKAEISPEEVNDIGELITWCAQQPWSDGRVITGGTSYLANTALYGLVKGSESLVGVICRAPDFDAYRHLMAPGGIANRWFVSAWGGATAAQDRNNIDDLIEGGYWSITSTDTNNVIGVRPVDQDDGHLLESALNEHQKNFNALDVANHSSLTYIENKFFEGITPLYDPAYKKIIENRNCPTVILCGWHDAGTALGALSLYNTLEAQVHLIIGPWNHSGTLRVDPYADIDDRRDISEECLEQTILLMRGLLESDFTKKEKEKPLFRKVEYYTLGENKWKVTRTWPPKNTNHVPFYLGEGGILDQQTPSNEEGCDTHLFDKTTTTGRFNRWFAQSSNQPILFPDRRKQDRKLLTYDSCKLDCDLEITGHPIAHLYIRPSSSDGQIFVYLEMIDPSGRVTLLTEGQLRFMHHKTACEKPPYKMYGPYHSLKKSDADLMIPKKLYQISLDLFPISILVKRGWRLRLAIALSDFDTFELKNNDKDEQLVVERNLNYNSRIEIPVVTSKKSG